MEKKFNLIDEKWIRVRDGNCTVTEVSLKEALLNAHEYTALAGELPTQDIAVLRMLLAVLHTVFSRVDLQGNPIALKDKDDAFDQWKSIWDNGKIPEKPISDYFDEWYDRFWLVHPERPFWQVAGLDRGTYYSAAKLNGEISESANKIRMFSKFSQEEKTTMSFSQAARWILHFNGFDDTSAKPTKQGSANSKLPSPGAGWLGKIGLTIVTGRTLFETMMYNLVMVRNGVIESEEKPVWETGVRTAERTEIPIPTNLAELYTLQSRRILLDVKNNSIIGLKMIGGDFFNKENAFAEPMTIWSVPQKANEAYTPKRHKIEKQLWREFSSFYPEDDNSTAGTILWFKNYVSRVLKRNQTITTLIASAQYGDKDFFIDNVFSDSVSMSVDILTEKGKAWRGRINEEIEKCNEVAKKVHSFAMNVHMANGGDAEDTEIGKKAKEQFFYKLDIPFREWLVSIDPEEDKVVEKLDEWIKIVYGIVRELADEISAAGTPQAYVGIKRNDGKVYSIPQAQNALYRSLKQIYDK